MHKRQVAYINRARELASKSVMRFQHGCVIVKRGVLIAEGYNRYVTNTKDWGVHAEEAALQRCRSEASGSTLYVVRISGKAGLLTESRPCARCTKRIEASGVKLVIYSGSR